MSLRFGPALDQDALDGGPGVNDAVQVVTLAAED